MVYGLWFMVFGFWFLVGREDQFLHYLLLVIAVWLLAVMPLNLSFRLAIRI
jgi:hypothetical protein